MINLEIIDTNSKVATKDNEQLYNHTLCCKIYNVFDKQIKKVEWQINNETKNIIENKPNFYNTEYKFFTLLTGITNFKTIVTYINNSIEEKSLNVILNNLPN